MCIIVAYMQVIYNGEVDAGGVVERGMSLSSTRGEAEEWERHISRQDVSEKMTQFE